MFYNTFDQLVSDLKQTFRKFLVDYLALIDLSHLLYQALCQYPHLFEVFPSFFVDFERQYDFESLKTVGFCFFRARKCYSIDQFFHFFCIFLCFFRFSCCYPSSNSCLFLIDIVVFLGLLDGLFLLLLYLEHSKLCSNI